MYIKSFESFLNKYNDEVRSKTKSILDKYKKDISDYLCEISDEFESSLKIVDINNNSHKRPINIFQFAFKFNPNQLDKVREIVYQDLFNRIKDDFPGTEIFFDLVFKCNNIPDMYYYSNTNYKRHFNHFPNNERNNDVEDIINLSISGIKEFPKQSYVGNKLWYIEIRANII